MMAVTAQGDELAALPIGDYRPMMRLTVDSWLASQSAAGFLPYQFDFLADKATEGDRISPGNILRQAFAAFTLAEYYRYTSDVRLQEPLGRALSAFSKHSLPISKGRVQRWVEGTHILSIPFARWKLVGTLDRLGLLYQASGSGSVVSPDGSYSTALAGTVALALLTELSYSQASGDNRFAESRGAWLNGLLSLRIVGGGFRETPAAIDDSDYYNGEGWLALAVYGDLNPKDAQAAKALVELDQAMMERYSDRPNPNFYHWGAMAAARRFKTTGDPQFLTFLQGQADFFFSRVQGQLKPGANNCAAMEGLAATLASLNQSGERDSDLAGRIRAWLSSEALKLPKLQIQPGQEGMPLGGDAFLRAPHMAAFSGSFLAGLYEPYTRVDAAAHCLDAMVWVERDGLSHSFK